MAARIEVAEKLRTQVRELEKEKRDVQRRYNEQVSIHSVSNELIYPTVLNLVVLPGFRPGLLKQSGRRLMTTNSILNHASNR